MREIKFRAWDARIGMMLQPKTIQHMAGCMPRLDLDNVRVTLMQYTGLKDKRGQEIYEGDIVETAVSGVTVGKPILGKVLYSEETTCWHCEESEESSYPLYSLENIEVIGNVHENPELLE